MRILKSVRFWLAVSFVVVGAAGSLISAERSSSSMPTAATKFVASLTPEQRQKASFAFDSDERMRWHFIPTGTAQMVPAKRSHSSRRCREPQRKLAHDLLKASLSQRGYLTASSIMDLETVLGALEAAQRAAAPPRRPARRRRRPIVRDPERYFFSIFGTPSAKDTWGWRVEGHHVSLHFTIVNGNAGGVVADVLRIEPGGSARGPEEGAAHSRRRRGRRARAADVARRVAARPRRSSTTSRRTTC